MARQYPSAYEIRPQGRIDTAVSVPGSKSITNRALVCAALASGESLLEGALESDDTNAMRQALAELGVGIASAGDRGGAGEIRVEGCGGRLRAPRRPIDARASGTTARFLTAAAALADGPVVVDGTPRMRERPIDDLVAALRGLGARIEILGKNGCPPVRVAGGGIPGGKTTIEAGRSSQFVSAVLLAAPWAQRDVVLEPRQEVVSRPYIDLTLAVMNDFGAHAAWTRTGSLRVAAPHGYRGTRYAIEPDASAATYPFAAAAISGGRVGVQGFPATSLQGDLQFLDLLAAMGCRVERSAGGISVVGPDAASALKGVDVDMNQMPDAVLTAAVVALFAAGPTRIRNVANLRIKETDRLAALERELRKLGAGATATGDGLTIEPPPGGASALRAGLIETYDDHRMAMAFSLAGLRIPGVVIRDPGCVAKTWPDYFEAMAFLGATPRE